MRGPKRTNILNFYWKSYSILLTFNIGPYVNIDKIINLVVHQITIQQREMFNKGPYEKIFKIIFLRNN